MKSKFLYQDVDVVLLAYKGVVNRFFVYRNYDNVLMETGKLFDNKRVIENGLVRSTFPFLAYRLAYTSHASMIISKFWCYENETGYLYFGPLRKMAHNFSFRTVLRSLVTLL